MNLKHLISPATTSAKVKADSKKSVLETIGKSIANELPDIEFQQILTNLLNREKLGSTAIGHGVALPHCRLANLDEPIAAIVQLVKPIEFDANDNEAVDLFFGLLVPEDAEEQHLEILAKVAEKFSQAEFRNKLRAATTNEELYTVAISD
ncbi:MAG: PTS IIA-like nitrogen regulatory protein PtsN [Gammaproteobacteria bacterium]|nr:PTS IIA-like nitrogen regulatory protein PtsN [Gammaproteobacteria bacterium]